MHSRPWENLKWWAIINQHHRTSEQSTRAYVFHATSTGTFFSKLTLIKISLYRSKRVILGQITREFPAGREAVLSYEQKFFSPERIKTLYGLVCCINIPYCCNQPTLRKRLILSTKNSDLPFQMIPTSHELFLLSFPSPGMWFLSNYFGCSFYYVEIRVRDVEEGLVPVDRKRIFPCTK